MKMEEDEKVTQMKDIFSVDFSLFDTIYIFFFIILKLHCLYFPHVDCLHGMFSFPVY